ncbi:MAG: flavin reductase family protein [Bowdeniella nasicola]|nr:flavin reductase family protein [Bowdeniella nasicola]
MDGSDSSLREEFRQIFRRHATGVTVITYCDGNQLGGFTASSVISVAAEPPTIAFAVTTESIGGLALAHRDAIVVNFLDDAASDTALRFAGLGGKRFADHSYELLPSGEPVLHAASAYLQAEITQRHETGDSQLMVAELRRVHIRDRDAELRPLIYLNRQFRRLHP